MNFPANFDISSEIPQKMKIFSAKYIKGNNKINKINANALAFHNYLPNVLYF